VDARPVRAAPPLEDRFAYDGGDLLDAWTHMHADFLRRGGPTASRSCPRPRAPVEAMLRGTPRSPGDVVATLEPGFGIATVGKLAIQRGHGRMRPRAPANSHDGRPLSGRAEDVHPQ